MDMNDTGEYSTLDNIRLSEGTEQCRAVLREAYERGAGEAAALFNDRDIRFTSLFLLLPEIASMELYSDLDEINNTAIELIRQIQGPKEPNNRIHDLSVNKDAVYSAMKWMLMTGADEDGLCDGYERILDVAASVLTGTYKDKSVLPVIDGLIFRRQKERRNIHALVWALFRINDPDALRQVAGHILSEDEDESAFACKLLQTEQRGGADNQERYENYIQWLEDNAPFLFFTDESFQYASDPVVCKVDYERKYLQKGGTLYKKTPIKPLSGDESDLLKAFEPLSDAEKQSLSSYSHTLHKENVFAWEEWMRSPIDGQITAANTQEEESL